MVLNVGFTKKRRGEADPKRLPPGQYLTDDFPVLSLGPTPQVAIVDYTLKISGLAQRKQLSYEELLNMPQDEIRTDIHCVTKWSKFDTHWKGVSLDYFFEQLGIKTDATHLLAYSYDHYSTNLPLNDLTGGKAWLATQYDNSPIEPIHGGPVRLLVPHLYFWKSAKWLNELQFIDRDVPGFWEERGYHNYGDPWKEQRYDGD